MLLTIIVVGVLGFILGYRKGYDNGHSDGEFKIMIGTLEALTNIDDRSLRDNDDYMKRKYDMEKLLEEMKQFKDEN